MTTAKISVDCTRKLTSRISPYIWGNFIEDIRDHMDAMLAYPLKGMDFEQGEAFPGVSAAWTPVTNAKRTVFRLEPAAPMHSGHSQCIKLYSADGGWAGLTQRIPVRGGCTFTVNLYMRASKEIGRVFLDLSDPYTLAEYDQAIVDLAGHDWREYTALLSVPRGCSEAMLTVRVHCGVWDDSPVSGMIWFDHISLLPTDHVAGVKRAVADMAHDLKCGMMRFGGNHISSYHWKAFVGPLYGRPSMMNEVWGGWATKYFGTDELIAFCRHLGVEPLICINFGSGSPQEAAEWVEYCNGDHTTPMGALRAAHGHPEPYGVKYWEVGNEIYGKWQIGHCDAETYATRYVEFQSKMRAVDATITLLGCGHWDMDWNQTLLDIAGESIDMLTVHLYPGSTSLGFSHDDDRVKIFETMRCFPEYTRNVVHGVLRLIRASDRLSHIKLAITEYNTMYYPANERRCMPDEHTLQAAVANAANLNEFIRNSDLIEIGSFSDLVNGWQGGCIRVGDGLADQFHGKLPTFSAGNIVYGTPTYHLLKLYANRDLDHAVHSTTDCGSFKLPDQDFFRRNSGDEPPNQAPLIDAVACLNQDGSRLTVFAVNRSLQSIECELDLQGFFPSEARGYEISGDDLDARNTICETEVVTSRAVNIQVNGGTISFALRPFSIGAYEFDRVR